MKWILIICLVGYGNGSGAAIHETKFFSREKCQKAADVINESLEKWSIQSFSACVER